MLPLILALHFNLPSQSSPTFPTPPPNTVVSKSDTSVIMLAQVDPRASHPMNWQDGRLGGTPVYTGDYHRDVVIDREIGREVFGD